MTPFKTPVKFNEKWINCHKDHSLCLMNHTIFDKKKKVGIKYKEYLCYTCRDVAREFIEKVAEKSAPLEKKIKKKKFTYEKNITA